jgi:hypothetical protein
MASTTSGTARASTISARAPRRPARCGVMFPAASTATGMLITTDSTVAQTTIASVCRLSLASSPREGKSSGSERDRKSAAFPALSTMVATLSRRSTKAHRASTPSARIVRKATAPWTVGRATMDDGGRAGWVVARAGRVS